ncbi:hypothetical protein Tco_0590013 [Tanacetum coccineum]
MVCVLRMEMFSVTRWCGSRGGDGVVVKGDVVVMTLEVMRWWIDGGCVEVAGGRGICRKGGAYFREGLGEKCEVGIKARRFEGTITIYNGDDEVTSQMGFFGGHHIRGLKRILMSTATNPTINAKVSEKDEMNGISHAYQKLKGFYKGVLNLGPDYL